VGGGVAATVKFKDRPKLDALLKVLAKGLAARYGDDSSTEDDEEERAVMQARRQKRLGRVQTSDWMLKQGRDALQIRGDWPDADNAVDQRADVDVPLRKKRKSTRASAFDPKRQKIIPSAGVDSDEDVLGVIDNPETDSEDSEE
jgi:hypothetical protein